MCPRHTRNSLLIWTIVPVLGNRYALGTSDEHGLLAVVRSGCRPAFPFQTVSFENSRNHDRSPAPREWTAVRTPRGTRRERCGELFAPRLPRRLPLTAARSLSVDSARNLPVVDHRLLSRPEEDGGACCGGCAAASSAGPCDPRAFLALSVTPVGGTRASCLQGGHYVHGRVRRGSC